MTTAVSQVLPKELRLSAPPTMPQARSYLFKQPSTNSSYSAGETIQINIPRLQRSYLTKDSYVTFKVQVTCNPETYDPGASAVNIFDGTTLSVTSGNATTYDSPKYNLVWDICGALGLVDRIEVFDYLGSTLLESTAGHGQLMSLLMDSSTNFLESSTHYACTLGTGAAQIYENLAAEARVDLAIPNSATTTGTTAAVKSWEAFNKAFSNVRYRIGEATSGEPWTTKASASTTYTKQFSIPLFSFLGLLSTKYAPLHNGYTVNLTTNTVATMLGFCSALNSAAAPTTSTISAFKISDVNFCCQVLELGPMAEGMLLSSTEGNPLVIPTKAYRNYVGQINASTSNYRLDLNLNVASLTNIIWIMRPTALKDSLAYRSLSFRVRNYLQNWYFQYGSSVLPQTTGIMARGKPGDADADATTQFVECYNEFMKSRHNLNRDNHDTAITPSNYTLDEVDAATNAAALNPIATKSGKFAAGLDLELISGRSNDMVCGLNTNGMNTSIYANFDPNKVSSVKECRVDAWCEYDAFVNIAPGIATTVSF